MTASTAAAASPDSCRRELRRAIAVLDDVEAAADPARLCEALAVVARCHRAVGALAEAEWYARRAIAMAGTLGTADARVDLLCELAELGVERAARMTQRADDARDARRTREGARDLAYQAIELARLVADPDWARRVLERMAALLRGIGDHDDAAALQRRAQGLVGGTALAA